MYTAGGQHKRRRSCGAAVSPDPHSVFEAARLRSSPLRGRALPKLFALRLPGEGTEKRDVKWEAAEAAAARLQALQADDAALPKQLEENQQAQSDTKQKQAELQPAVLQRQRCRQFVKLSKGKESL